MSSSTHVSRESAIPLDAVNTATYYIYTCYTTSMIHSLGTAYMSKLNLLSVCSFDIDMQYF